MKIKIDNWLKKNRIENYFFKDNDKGISFQFLVSDNRKRFLSYVKRLYGERVLYNYDSNAKIEKHIFNNFLLKYGTIERY